MAKFMYESFLELVRTFGTPLAACVAAFVAYRFGNIQARISRRQVRIASDAALTARNKLRMDMYQERLAIQTSIMKMFGELGVMGHLTPEDEHKYLTGISSSRWVFGKDMQEFLETKVWHAMADYVAAQNSYNENSNTEHRKQLAVAKASRRKELLALREEADHRFAEFMEFERAPPEQAVE